MFLCLEVLYCFFVKQLLNIPIWVDPSLGPVVQEEPGPLLPVTGPAFSLTPTTRAYRHQTLQLRLSRLVFQKGPREVSCSVSSSRHLEGCSYILPSNAKRWLLGWSVGSWNRSLIFATKKALWLMALYICVCGYTCMLDVSFFSLLSCVWPSVTMWTVAHQASLSMGFSRQEYWSGLPVPSPGDLPNPGIEPTSPVLQVDSLPLSRWGSPSIKTWPR